MQQAGAYDQNGGKHSENELVSASGKTKILLKSKETIVHPDQIIYINIHLVGEKGAVESNADKRLTVTVDGGELLGFGSANLCTEERFDSGSYTTYYGRALAVAKSTDIGELIIQADGEGLEPAETKISVID